MFFDSDTPQSSTEAAKADPYAQDTDCIPWLFSLEGLRKTSCLFLSLIEESHGISGNHFFLAHLREENLLQPKHETEGFLGYLLQTKTLVEDLA